MNGQNLDLLCARYGFQIAEEVHSQLKNQAENHITKSLGVLQENGLYAFFLYQDSRKRKKEEQAAEELKKKAVELLRSVPFEPFQAEKDPLEVIRDGLASRLDDLLLAKRLLEQALIYARYHAKALEG
jgi:protein subunit release factor B